MVDLVLHLKKECIDLASIFLGVASLSSTTAIIQCLGEVNTYTCMMPFPFCFKFQQSPHDVANLIKCCPGNKLGSEFLIYSMCNLIVYC